MTAIENLPVEQLWYTWSDVGLSSIHAGFRIRAVSSGLTEIYSERVKSMDRHLRYVLPPGTDRFAITPDMAPVCLEFVRSEWNNEYLLVHKQYIGQDGVGRQGNFFIHLLALGEASPNFSIEDAIFLWGASLWKKSDDALDRRSNKLATVTLNDLYQQQNLRLDLARVGEHLPFVIEAFLTRQDRTPIYIAAPAASTASITYLIAGLVMCLPRQLFADLTFSTYEPDVTKAPTSIQIVGTSWIDTSDRGIAPPPIFPPQFYREKLAVNCSSGEQSPLTGHPLTINRPLAKDFALFAAQCLLSNTREQLYTLRDQAEKASTLTIDDFLRLYADEIVKTGRLLAQDIEYYLDNPAFRIDKLRNKTFRQNVIELAMSDYTWWSERLQPRLLKLREEGRKESAMLARQGIQPSQPASGSPKRGRKGATSSSTAQGKSPITLIEALAILAESTIPTIIAAMKTKSRPLHLPMTLLDLLDASLLPGTSYEIWEKLLKGILKSQEACRFLWGNCDILLWLLDRWNAALPVHPQYDKVLGPLLVIPWPFWGQFLRLRLDNRHSTWNIIALQNLIADTPPTAAEAQDLARNYAQEITLFLKQLLQAPQQLLSTATFAILLLEKGYQGNPDFTELIEQLLGRLIKTPDCQLTAKALVETMAMYGYGTINTPTSMSQIEALLATLFNNGRPEADALLDTLVHKGYRNRKNLVDLVVKSSGNKVGLYQIISRVLPTPEEQATFFVTEGRHYFSTPEQRQAMRFLYAQLLPYPGKMERLFILLEAPQQLQSIVEVLHRTDLQGDELAQFLDRYGKQYFQNAQQWPQLTTCVIDAFQQLLHSGRTDKKMSIVLDYLAPSTSQQPPVSPHSAAELLRVADLTPSEQIQFLEELGETYLSAYPQLPILTDYITNYIHGISMRTGDNPKSRELLIFLDRSSQSLALDISTRQNLQCWLRVDHYLSRPNTDPKTLQRLVQSLGYLGLLNRSTLNKRLVQAFVSCVQTEQDFATIITITTQEKKVAKLQLLYSMAEQRGRLYQSQQESDERALVPYIVYALRIAAEEQDRLAPEEPDHFILVFLDSLLRAISTAPYDLSRWQTLNVQVTKQPHISPEAWSLWSFYLEKLQILEKLADTELIESLPTTQQPFLGQQQKPLSTLWHYIQPSQHNDMRGKPPRETRH